MAVLTSTRRRGRPPIPEGQQRTRLIAAATRAFQKSRYEKTRVADIVREAGMSSRSFYQFFESKADIAAEVMHQEGLWLVETLENLFAQTENPIERIDRGLRAYLRLFSTTTVDFDRLSGAAGLRVREARRENVRHITELVFRECSLAHRRGLISRPPDRISIEVAITGIEGLSFRYYGEGRGAELPELHPTLLEILVRALI